MEETFLRKKNEEFIRKIKENDPSYFNELRKGQNPEYFVLSCSDSRVSPSFITEMPLGKMFIHRNIANQVNLDDESFSAGLYFALKHLKIKKILIEGHTYCGGIKAAWEENKEENLRCWLNNVRESLPEKPLKRDIPEDELARINVLSQVEKLKSHPVYMDYGTDIEIIGCLFHVESGELEWLDTEDKEEDN